MNSLTCIRNDLEELEHSRVRKRRERSGAKFSGAIERFVGDLLRAKAGTIAPALIFRSIGKSNFDHDPVKYDTFTKVLKDLGLKGSNALPQDRVRPR